MSKKEDETPEIAGALCAPPPPTDPISTDVPQPRQPTSLKGLLKFAMEATKAEDAPHESQFQPLDEARKKFLEQAIASLTIDVVEVLLKQIKVLETVGSIKEDEDPTEYTTALDTISEFVCDIDTANDFHKIGGFAIMQPCLQCKNPKIRAQACNLLAELCQNNPYCQRVVLENGFMPLLVEIVERDPADEVIVKALYAISCIIRENPTGVAQFILYKGVQVFLGTVQRNVEKFNTKICFLLSALCASQADFKGRLIFMGYIPVLFSLISTPPRPCDEHVLALILKLIEENPAAVGECKQSALSAKEVLELYLSAIQGNEEYTNEEEYCNTIFNILFPQK